jgi:hypothetical protein
VEDGVRASRRAGAALLALLAACGSPGGGGGPAATPAAPSPLAHTDTTGLALVPAGYGSLRQEDIAVSIRLPQILVRCIPLDEATIRLLSPDSYRALRGLRESQHDAIAADARRLGIEQPSLWYLQYYGLQPDARFSARDVVISGGGRDHLPLDVLPLSAGFSNERVGQGQVQSAIYVFDGGIDPTQPLAIAVESVRSSAWSAVLPVIERERALVRSRAAAGPPS